MSKQKQKHRVESRLIAPPPVQPEIKKTDRWKPYLVLTIFAFVLYGNTLNHSFVWDDPLVFTENKFTMQGINGISNIPKYDMCVGFFWKDKTKTVEQVEKEMINFVGGRYRPLSMVTFALEVQFFGKKNSDGNDGFIEPNPFVSHLNNILLYLATTCLLYLILCRLFPVRNLKIQKFKNLKDTTVSAKNLSLACEGDGERWYLSFPFIATLLFLAHPIHTEVVANAKGRDEIMALLGALATLWFTIKYFDTHKIYHLLLSGLCFFLALLSKENAITFLAIIPITIYYFINKGINPLVNHLVKSMIPLIIASVVFFIIRSNVLGGDMNTEAALTDLINNPYAHSTKAETMATIFYSLILYVKLLFFPHPLTWDYYPHHIEIVNWSNPIAILSFLFYLGITAYAIYGFIKHATVKSTNPQIHKSTIISYSILVYLLPLSIVSNLFFPIGTFMAERFVYVSSIGFCIFIAWLIYNYVPKITKNINSVTYLMLIILCLFSIKTISRNKDWKDDFTLYTTDVKTSKNSVKGNFNVGREYYKKTNNLKNEKDALKRTEFCKKSLHYLQRASKIHNYLDVVELLGNVALDCGECVAINPNEIIQMCDDMLERDPNLGKLYYIKGKTYGKYLNNIELMLTNFEKANSLDFGKDEAFYNDIGIAYGISGNYEKSIENLLKAIELGADVSAYINLGLSYQQIGDTKNADFYLTKGNEMREQKVSD